jgi:hypothetical protein
MKHECGLCLRDNNSCMIGKSFLELLFGKVKDCSIYEDYRKGLLKEKKRKEIHIKNNKKIKHEDWMMNDY